MFGGVPISVTIPPRIVANDKGIKLSAGDRLLRVAAWMSTGINKASAATLFMKLDIIAPATPIILMCNARLRVESTTCFARQLNRARV